MSTGGATVEVSDEVARRAERDNLLTLGVEEEYLLVGADTLVAVPAVEDVFDHVPAELRESVQHEYVRSQIEVASPPVVDLQQLWHALGELRFGVSEAAAKAGARLLAVGASPAPGPDVEIVDVPRYHRMVERFGDLSPGGGSCGMHVHVGIPDAETGVQVLNHLRPWLPILQAATANSPFFAGRDTGYASWRSMLWERWPTVGATPYLRDHDEYERMIAGLIASGAMLDDGMLYWYARLSARYPTVEVRIGDVCPTLDDTLLIAALIRGLVGTVLADVGDGKPAPNPPHHLLNAAHWRAARDGLEGRAVDPETLETRPAWHLMRQLFDRVRPELERHGDLELVTVLMGRLRARGTGAARQRAVYAASGDLADVITWLTDHTRAR